MSNKIGVNDTCPCGSGKKYKKCYLSNNEECNKYTSDRNTKTSEEYKEIFNEVATNLSSGTQELCQLFYKNKEDQEIISPRMQLVGIFTIIDVLGNYWYCYTNRTGKPSERFDEIVDRFCLTYENIEYKNKKYLNNINAEGLRKLRDNIVHFYGLGQSHNFCIIPGSSKRLNQNQIDEVVLNFSRIKIDLIFIQPVELQKIVIKGAELMLEYFKNDVISAETHADLLRCLESIKRIDTKLKNEGAIRVTKDMAEKVNLYTHK